MVNSANYRELLALLKAQYNVLSKDEFLSSLSQAYTVFYITSQTTDRDIPLGEASKKTTIQTAGEHLRVMPTQIQLGSAFRSVSSPLPIRSDRGLDCVSS